MYEHRRQPLLSRSAFHRRLARHGAVAVAIVVGSLLIGMVGYHALEGLSWIDAFLNAAMLLGGMGPVSELRSSAGKLFAGFYALYSGMVFLLTVGVIFAPFIHRFLHRFHAELGEHESGRGPQRKTGG